MANEISSQITSTTLKSRPSEPSSKPALSPADAVSNRQNIAAYNAVESVSAVASGNDNEQITTKAELEQAVSDINAYVQTVNRELQFRVDEALPLGRSVVTVIDADTEETIREFPSKEALALAHRLRDEAGTATQSQIEGLIISARA